MHFGTYIQPKTNRERIDYFMGSRSDSSLIYSPLASSGDNILRALAIFDFPLSFTIDTVLFPFLIVENTTLQPKYHFFKYPFDVSRSDSKLIQDLWISDDRGCVLYLEFDYTDLSDADRVFKLVGEAKGHDPGIVIPLHLRILNIDNKELPPKLIHEYTVLTQNQYSHGARDYWRELSRIALTQGIYRVEVSTIKEIPEFSGISTYIQMSKPIPFWSPYMFHD